MMVHPLPQPLDPTSVLALRRGKSSDDSGDGGNPDDAGDFAGAPPPTPRWVVAAAIVGLLLIFGGLFLFLTGGADAPDPLITGAAHWPN